jgi:hypothetical protein
MAKLSFCARANKVSFPSELEAKIVLARRVWKDKGEVRYYRCPHTNHYHLTSKEAS